MKRAIANVPRPCRGVPNNSGGYWQHSIVQQIGGHNAQWHHAHVQDEFVGSDWYWSHKYIIKFLVVVRRLGGAHVYDAPFEIVVKRRGAFKCHLELERAEQLCWVTVNSDVQDIHSCHGLRQSATQIGLEVLAFSINGMPESVELTRKIKPHNPRSRHWSPNHAEVTLARHELLGAQCADASAMASSAANHPQGTTAGWLESITSSEAAKTAAAALSSAVSAANSLKCRVQEELNRCLKPKRDGGAPEEAAAAAEASHHGDSDDILGDLHNDEDDDPSVYAWEEEEV